MLGPASVISQPLINSLKSSCLKWQSQTIRRPPTELVVLLENRILSNVKSVEEHASETMFFNHGLRFFRHFPGLLPHSWWSLNIFRSSRHGANGSSDLFLAHRLQQEVVLFF